jgi:hypothetical protein
VSWRASRRRRTAWFGLIAFVLTAHALLALRVAASMIGWNSAPPSRPLQVVLTQRLLPTAPPQGAVTPVAAAAPAPRPARAVRPARASSQPAPASAPEPEPDSRAELQAQALALAERLADAQRAQAAQEQASAVVAAAPASAPAPVPAASVAGPARPPFQWPPSTRLTYTLTGERGGGKLYGKAAVEWRRDGARYQVQFDIHITPMIDQRMFSEGTIGEQGLEPAHYDETFTFLLSQPRRRKVEFGATDVTLNNGTRVPRLPQTQDGASQFVQFVWMFYSHPEYLAPGNVVQIPLALSNNLRRWNYLVIGQERLDLAFGTLDAVHLKPVLDGPRRANEYPFEIWTAPSLQYLPVQILVRTDDQTWALLALDDLPLQAAGERPPRPPPRAPKPFPDPPPIGER